MSKRLAFIIDNLSGGGAERVVLTLAEKINDLGHEALVITLSEGQEHPIPAGVTVVQAPEPARLPAKLRQFKRHAQSLQKTLDQLHRQKPIDLLISNLPRTDRIVKHIRGYKRYFCIHNTYSIEYLAHRTGLDHYRKQQQLKKLYHGENLIAVSKGVMNDLIGPLQLPASRITQIYNPFDALQIQSLAQQALPEDYGEYLIHVGRFNRQKRHDRLFEAFLASGMAARYKLLLLGASGEISSTDIQAQINKLGLTDRVVTLGFSSNPYPYIQAAKALILSSDFEGFGNVLVEALICNTPVVSTRCPSGPSEILTEELERFLSEVNTESLAEKIREVCLNPPEITPQHYKDFDAKAIAQQYLDLANTSQAT